KDYLMKVKSTTSHKKFSNGRFVRNVIEKSIRAQAMRLLMGDQYLKSDLMTIKSQDLSIKEEASGSV
ncbi:stage V sporulation protein K, partial [Bacillus inaquosorum]|nr:stage V sporulation protein K [Bacillus inaquosorum]